MTRWTKQEEAYLRKYYTHIGAKKIAKALNRSWSSVVRKATRFKLRRERKGDIIGFVRGKLKAIKWVSGDSIFTRKSSQLLCKCSCGNMKVMSPGNFIHNKGNISCGCSRFGKTNTKNAGWKGVGELSGSLYGFMKGSATARGLPFTVSKQYLWNLFLKQERKCAFSGIVLVLPVLRKGSFKTASLDRIDSNKPYVPGNVQWVHKDVNFMKQDKTDKDFVKMCKAIAQYRS